MNEMLYRISKKPYIGRIIAKIISRYTGGEMESLFLREYTKKKYNVDVGLYSYGSCFRKRFNAGGKVKVGRYCSLANNVSYISFEHPVNYISTSPYFFENYYTEKYNVHINDMEKYQSLLIGNDVWIGVNVTILSKCHNIGNGAIIGAGSVVTRDVPAYAIVAGNPAKVIRYRFDRDTIEKIEKSQWWEKTPKELMKYYRYVDKPEQTANLMH